MEGVLMLTDIDMLKTKRKRTDRSSNLSDSNSSNDKLYQKKKQTKPVDQKKKTSNGKNISSDNVSDDSSPSREQVEKIVSTDAPMVIFSSSDEDSNDNDVNGSDVEHSKKDTNIKLDKNKIQAEKCEVNKKNNLEESATENEKKNNSDEEISDNSVSKIKEDWKKDKLLTEKLGVEVPKELNSSEEEQKYRKKKEKLIQKEKKEKKQQKKRFRIFESESDSESKTEQKNIKNEDKVQESDNENDKKSSNSEGSSGEFFQTNLKRKKAATSSEKNSSDENPNKKKKNVRKRIKRIKDSDESSEDEDGKTKTRKNIRSVIKDNSLSKSTREAAKEEEKRKKRIAERQKTYNEMFEMDNETDKRVDKVVLDFNTETKEELLAVHPKLVEKLKPHQAKGVKFMYDACFESLERSKKEKGSGCILAHCMGLGKTLQVITLIHTLITNKKTNVHTAMVVCPLSTVLNWVNEFKIWLSDINDGDDINVFELSRYKKNYERAYQIDDWQECGGVLVIGYEMYRILSSTTNKKIRKKVMNSLQKGLVDPGPDLVVCDEGHLLKNEKARLSMAMNRLKSLRRIILTGTPLQNNLKEYYCMIQFVKPNLLGKYSEYTNRFVNPITNGQYTDSTPHDIAVMKRRSHVLHKMLDGVVERRDYSVLAPFLPPKHEYVIFLRLTDIQVKLYEIYMKEFARRGESGRAVTLFNDFQELQRIWTHPRMMRAHSDKYERTQEKKAWLDEDSEGSLKDFIDDDDDSAESSASESDVSLSSDGSPKPSKKGKNKGAPLRRRTRAMAAQMDEEDIQEETVEESKPHNPTEWWVKYIEGDELDNIDHSAKLLLLFDILKKCEAIGDKLLVFSQSLYSLDLIEYFLEKVDEATQNGANTSDLLHGHKGSWSLGLDYFRLDGSSSVENRAAWCKSFNNEDNHRARLFLISTKAGGLGINLVAANRVIIFDVSWNPSHDVQSIFRIYRFGQKKPCYVYRFIAMGTMEEKVYERQVTKQAISKRVIDEQQIDRHYNQNDLAELYKFAPVPEDDRPIPMLPKDRMFAELLQEYETLIYRYHEHDSLLENKEEEELDEAERKAAWEEFENEKTAKPAMNNVMTGVTRQAQIAPDQAAYIIQMMLRQENPQWTGEQVRQGVPVVLQQMYANAVSGDWTMYNRVLGYQQHLTFQQQLLAAQTRLMNPSMQNQAIYNMHNPGMQNPGIQNPGMQNVFMANEKARQAQYQANQNRMYTAGLPSTSTQNQQFDPNEVVNID